MELIRRNGTTNSQCMAKGYFCNVQSSGVGKNKIAILRTFHGPELLVSIQFNQQYFDL